MYQKLAIIFTLKFPTVENIFTGFIELEEVPSPKSHVAPEGTGLLVFKKFALFPWHTIAGIRKVCLYVSNCYKIGFNYRI